MCIFHSPELTPCLHSSSFGVKDLEKTIKGPFTNYSPSLPISKPNPKNFIRAWNVLISFKTHTILSIFSSERSIRKQLEKQPEDRHGIFFGTAVSNKELKISQMHWKIRSGARTVVFTSHTYAGM